MSNVIYGTKALGGRIQQWQGPGTPNANHVGLYFAGGHGAEPERVRGAAKELRYLYRRLDLNTPQADMEHLSKVIRDLESLLPRDNPKRAPIDHKFAGSLFSAGQRSTALAYLRGTITKGTARELAAAKVRKARR